jgi:hypothetical protein
MGVGKGEDRTMENTFNSLTQILFKQLDKISNGEIKGDELKEEMDRADSMVKMSSQLVNIGSLQLSAQKHADEYGYSSAKHMPKLLEVGDARENTKRNR